MLVLTFIAAKALATMFGMLVSLVMLRRPRNKPERVAPGAAKPAGTGRVSI